MLKKICACVGMLLLTSQAKAGFSTLIDFGDSLSDVGNDYTASFGIVPGSPGYTNGHFSNGQIWVEKLGQDLGLGTPTASLKGGNDFAYGGVTSGTGYTTDIISLPNIETQVTGWTSSHTANSSQLFTVLGGANDLLNLLGGTSTTTPAQAADNIATSVHDLYADGARNILVANLPDLGLTPRFYNTAGQSVATAATLQFNTELATDLSTQLTTSPGLDIYNLNLFALIDSAEANPSAYGLTDVHDQAYTGDNTFAGNGSVVSDPSGYLFFDSIHPTTTGHALIAAAAVSAIPEPGSLSLIFVAAVLLGQRRR
jgi:phospholipase/lecithinase/hemolysin